MTAALRSPSRLIIRKGWVGYVWEFFPLLLMPILWADVRHHDWLQGAVLAFLILRAFVSLFHLLTNFEQFQQLVVIDEQGIASPVLGRLRPWREIEACAAIHHSAFKTLCFFPRGGFRGLRFSINFVLAQKPRTSLAQALAACGTWIEGTRPANESGPAIRDLSGGGRGLVKSRSVGEMAKVIAIGAVIGIGIAVMLLRVTADHGL